jgi:hypothetical protein
LRPSPYLNGIARLRASKIFKFKMWSRLLAVFDSKQPAPHFEFKYFRGPLAGRNHTHPNTNKEK